MKTIKFLFFIIFGSLSLSSCLVNDEVDSDIYDDSANVIGFRTGTLNASIIADGSTADYTMQLLVSGPTASDITSSITASLEVDSSSDAIEGTHFTLDSNTVTFEPSNNLLTTLGITILSEGVTAPDEKFLKLNLINSSDSATLVSGRTGSILISIKYLCNSDLAGMYDNPDLPANTGDVAEIIELGPGQYRVSALPYLGWNGVDGIYFDIIDDCGNLTITNCEITEAFGALVEGEATVENDGSWTLTYVVYNGATPDTGVWFDFSTSPSTYTPQ
jgi:hypothetical protein